MANRIKHGDDLMNEAGVTRGFRWIEDGRKWDVPNHFRTGALVEWRDYDTGNIVLGLVRDFTFSEWSKELKQGIFTLEVLNNEGDIVEITLGAWTSRECPGYEFREIGESITSNGYIYPAH